MFKMHTSKLIPWLDNVHIVDSVFLELGSDIFEPLLVAVNLKAIGFKWSIDILLTIAPYLSGIPKGFGVGP